MPTLTIPASAVTDSAGNNLAAAVTSSTTIDKTAPTLESVSPTSPHSFTGTNTLVTTWKFDKVVTVSTPVITPSANGSATLGTPTNTGGKTTQPITLTVNSDKALTMTATATDEATNTLALSYKAQQVTTIPGGEIILANQPSDSQWVNGFPFAVSLNYPYDSLPLEKSDVSIEGIGAFGATLVSVVQGSPNASLFPSGALTGKSNLWTVNVRANSINTTYIRIWIPAGRLTIGGFSNTKIGPVGHYRSDLA